MINKIDKGENKETIVYATHRNPRNRPQDNNAFLEVLYNPNAPDKKRWGTAFSLCRRPYGRTILERLKALYIKNNQSSSDVTRISRLWQTSGMFRPPAVRIREEIVKQPGVLYGDNKKNAITAGTQNTLRRSSATNAVEN
jgi:hypothetical protein